MSVFLLQRAGVANGYLSAFYGCRKEVSQTRSLHYQKYIFNGCVEPGLGQGQALPRSLRVPMSISACMGVCVFSSSNTSCNRVIPQCSILHDQNMRSMPEVDFGSKCGYCIMFYIMFYRQGCPVTAISASWI